MDLWDFETPDKTLESLAGIPSSKNLLLMNMLHHAHIKVDPIMISTREHGRLVTELPQLRQFNHLLARVVLENDILYLDASDQFCPAGVLGTECAVHSGLLVTESGGKIIKIKAKQVRNQTHISSDMSIDSEGIITAHSSFSLKGFPAYRAKQSILNESLHDYCSERLETTFEEFIIDSVWVEENDDENVLVYHINYQIINFCEKAGNLIYMPTPMLNKENSNPLKAKKRLYPVDFAYPMSESESVKFSLADNMGIDELPEKIKDKSRYASFSTFCFKSDQKFELNRQFVIKKTSFMPSEYKELRRIYNSMVNSDQSQIVLTIN
jgi:hypothetical protein